MNTKKEIKIQIDSSKKSNKKRIKELEAENTQL